MRGSERLGVPLSTYAHTQGHSKLLWATPILSVVDSLCPQSRDKHVRLTSPWAYRACIRTYLDLSLLYWVMYYRALVNLLENKTPSSLAGKISYKYQWSNRWYLLTRTSQIFLFPNQPAVNKVRWFLQLTSIKCIINYRFCVPEHILQLNEGVKA